MYFAAPFINLIAHLTWVEIGLFSNLGYGLAYEFYDQWFILFFQSPVEKPSGPFQQMKSKRGGVKSGWFCSEGAALRSFRKDRISRIK